jgi:hypothetical protein
MGVANAQCEIDVQSAGDVISTIALAADAQLCYVFQPSELLLHTAPTDAFHLFLLGQMVDLMVSHAESFLSVKLLGP